MEIWGASSQRLHDFSHGPQHTAGGGVLPTKQLLSNVTFFQLFFTKRSPEACGVNCYFRFSLSFDPLLPSCHCSVPPTPPTPRLFSLKDEHLTFCMRGSGTFRVAGPLPGLEQLSVFIFIQKRVTQGVGGQHAASWEEFFTAENRSLGCPGQTRTSERDRDTAMYTAFP